MLEEHKKEIIEITKHKLLNVKYRQAKTDAQNNDSIWLEDYI